MLQVLTEEAAGCCRRGWFAAVESGKLVGVRRWACKRCGTEFEPRMHEGLQMWDMVAPTALVKR